MASILNRLSAGSFSPSHDRQGITVNEEGGHPKMLSQKSFLRMLHIEQKRTARTQGRYALLMLAFGTPGSEGMNEQALTKVQHALLSFTRDTDLAGWYRASLVIGVIFTEIGSADEKSVEQALLVKIARALEGALSNGQIDDLRLLFQVFPAGSGETFTSEAIVFEKYRDFMRNDRRKAILFPGESFALFPVK